VTSSPRERDALIAIARAAADHHWTIDLRHHPRYDRSPAFYAPVVDAAGPALAGDRAAPRPLADALAACDAVVLVGAPSSVIPVALLAGRPTVLLTGPSRVAVRRRWGLGGLPAFGRVADLIAALPDLVAAARADGGAAARRAGGQLLAPGADAASVRMILEASKATRPRVAA
jgi:hypothetical protein